VTATTCPIYGPIERLRTMLATSTVFQTLVGVETEDLGTAMGAPTADMGADYLVGQEEAWRA